MRFVVVGILVLACCFLHNISIATNESIHVTENDTTTEELWIRRMAWFLLGLSVVTVLGLLVQVAPYGRYSGTAGAIYGPPIPGKIAWILQETPCVVLALVALYYGRSYNSQLLPNWILLGLFLLHYVNRSFIFPLLIRGGKPTPFVIFLLAFIFCVFNGYLQCRYLATYAVYPSNWITDPRFVIGVLLFFAGMGINIHSDSILRNLRKPGETTYKIPRGGMFELISGANFFGEILEWGGFALASWSVVGLAFFVYTMSNIGPRAYHHHQWYKSKFEDYPKNRKAIIPFIL